NVDGGMPIERRHRYSHFFRDPARFLRRRYTHDLQSGFAEFTNEYRRGRTRTESNDHAVANLLERRQRSLELEVTGHMKSATRRRSSSSRTCTLYPQSHNCSRSRVMSE